MDEFLDLVHAELTRSVEENNVWVTASSSSISSCGRSTLATLKRLFPGLRLPGGR